MGWKSPQPGREASVPSLSHALCFLSLSESTDNLADPSSAQNYEDFRIRNGTGRGEGRGTVDWEGEDKYEFLVHLVYT